MRMAHQVEENYRPDAQQIQRVSESHRDCADRVHGNVDGRRTGPEHRREQAD